MAQQLGTFAADAGQSGLGSCTHTAQLTNACNSSSKGSDALHWPSQAPAHIHRDKNTHTHIKIKYKNIPVCSRSQGISVFTMLSRCKWLRD